MLFLMAAPYAGINGSFNYSTRTLTLDKDFEADERAGIVVSKKNSTNQGAVGLHLGYTCPIKKAFIGAEAFLGKMFGGEHFKQNFHGGAKAILGINLAENFQIYSGVGVDFAQIKTLKISLKHAGQDKVAEIFKDPVDNATNTPLDYKIYPQLLIHLGSRIFISQKVSFNVDGEYLISSSKKFEKTKSSILNNVLDEDSSEQYSTLRIKAGVSYHFGGKSL